MDKTEWAAGRNTGAKLLTCLVHDKENACIHPVEVEYSFDTWGCFKVLSME